ncbi:ankyrin repeat-containing protein BDA1-like [Humulus lupulus]|uniref:ankyrin repeat-containing protein BDA1-like n=1 Tax=Humulus lupulus TaxID=3486 RepID=UPI002B413FB1|nr:ankyrin repeat-containing protein BDA1-like [Humulus lupulus]
MSSTRLFEASLKGDVEALQQLIQENPLILAEYALVSPHENPLHIATKAGKLSFVKEISKLKPELVEELNKDGFRPLDIASALGHAEIVKALIKSCTTTTSLCRLKGRDGRTAIHYAAMRGKLEVIDELISSSKECVEDLTSLGETALHLAVKYSKFEAFTHLVEWVEKIGEEEIVNWGDNDGNTVLHLAVARKQHEVIFYLLLLSRSTKLEINARNSRGLTAMDIIDIQILENPIDIQLKETLQQATGATLNRSSSSHDHNSSNVVVSNINQLQEFEADQKEDWIKYFRYKRRRDSPSDTRNALLVVATLIATVTFQAGVNPPNSFSTTKSTNIERKVNADDDNNSYTLLHIPDVITPSPVEQEMPYIPGKSLPFTIGFGAVLANLGTLAASEMFLFGNSLGLTASLNVIIYLTAGFPFQRELHISIYSMMFAYGWSVQGLQSENNKGGVRNVILGLAFLLPFILRWFPRWAKRIRLWWINMMITRNSRVEHYPTL